MPSRCQIVRYDIPLAKARGQHSPVYRRLLAMGFVRLDFGTRTAIKQAIPSLVIIYLAIVSLAKSVATHVVPPTVTGATNSATG